MVWVCVCVCVYVEVLINFLFFFILQNVKVSHLCSHFYCCVYMWKSLQDFTQAVLGGDGGGGGGGEGSVWCSFKKKFPLTYTF